nr:hypothetical protein [Deinococcus radiodurans]
MNNSETPAPGPDSLLALAFPSDPQVSPDGKQVAFVLAQISEEDPAKPDKDFARPRYRSGLWLSEGGAARPLTHAETGRGDSAPAGRPTVRTWPLSAVRAR